MLNEVKDLENDLKFILEKIKEQAAEIDSCFLEKSFNKILEIKKKELDPLKTFHHVKFVFISNSNAPDVKENGLNLNLNLMDFGIIRKVINDLKGMELHEIRIPETMIPFLPFILIREIYYCFIPPELSHLMVISLTLYHLSIAQLKKLRFLPKSFFNELDAAYMNQEALSLFSGEYSALFLHKWFQDVPLSNDVSSNERAILQYFQLHGDKISAINDQFYDLIFKDQIRDFFKNMHGNQELIETIWALSQIFYNKKIFTSNEEYKSLFKEYKSVGKINTSLSLRKFSKNLRLIQYSPLSPSYFIDWSRIGIKVFYCFFQFHPSLLNSIPKKIIQHMPFYGYNYQVLNSLENRYWGFFVIPSTFVGDLKQFLIQLNKLNICSYSLKESIETENCLNLNYFKMNYHEFLNKLIQEKLIENRFILKRKFKRNNQSDLSLNLIEYTFLNRLNNWGPSGFSFQSYIKDAIITLQKYLNEALSSLKSNLMNLKLGHDGIVNNKYVRSFFFSILKSVKGGFFHLKEIICLLKDFSESPSFETLIQKKGKKQKNIIMELACLKNTDFLISKNLPFLSDIQDKSQIDLLFNFITSLEALNVFDVNTVIQYIRKPPIFQKFLIQKNIYLKKIQEENLSGKITIKYLTHLYEKYLKNKVIAPFFINTLSVSHFCQYIFDAILSPDNFNSFNQKLTQFNKLIPRLLVSIFKNNKEKQIGGYLSVLSNKKEWFLFFLNYFGKDIKFYYRGISDGFFSFQTSHNFYDFGKKEFIYDASLFKELNKYVKYLLKANNITNLSSLPKINHFQAHFPSVYDNLMALNNEKLQACVLKLQKENENKYHLISMDIIRELRIIRENLKDILKKPFHYENLIKTLQSHLQSLLFFTNYKAFSLEQYYLYIRVIDTSPETLDFKLLLSNTFQTVQISAAEYCPDAMFFISYLFPQDLPNLSYLKWLLFSKKAIKECILFKTEVIHEIFNFDHNFSAGEWRINTENFRAHANLILTEKHREHREHHAFSLYPSNDVYPPNSEEFSALLKVHGLTPKDLSSFIFTPDKCSKEQHDALSLLLKKKLIHPYMNLKNLNLSEEIHLLILNIPKDKKNLLISIFQYFNFGFIKEISGKSYVYGDQKFTLFQGFFISFWIPMGTDLKDLISSFEQVLISMGIKKFMFLTDLIDVPEILPFSEKELKQYNPLTTLEWDSITNSYKNVKLFNEFFEKQYPSLTSQK